jgi:hypothetical protein
LDDGYIVHPGASVTIPVAFRAEGQRARSAQFTIASGSTDLATISLEGNAIASGISASPSCDDGGLKFGFVPPGATIERALTIRNEGSKPLTISELVILSMGTQAFSLASASPTTIPADDPATPELENEAQVIIAFTPTPDESLGFKTAELLITNSSITPVLDSVCLFGNSGGPHISCTPETLDFGVVAPGASSTLEYVCTNVGSDDPTTLVDQLYVESVSTHGPEYTASIRNPDGSVGPSPDGYAAGDVFTVEVTYLPVDTGADETTIDISSNALLAPVHSTRVTGDGISAP